MSRPPAAPGGREVRPAPPKAFWNGPALSVARQREEMLAFLTLCEIKGVGHRTLEVLAQGGLSFANALEAGPDSQSALLRRHPRAADGSAPDWRPIRADAADRAAKMADVLEAAGIALVFRNDPRFPLSLMDLARPPHWLFVQGPSDVLSKPSVAMVGTRKPTGDGLFLARYVGACLEDWQCPTVSGLANGIDQLAHESSIRAGLPTVAVLGTGILDDYPKGSEVLRAKILHTGGTIVSEYLPRESYCAANFVQRNRLQAALGRVLVPVEWARRSGTAHTVRFASDLGRPIACLRLPDWPSTRVVLEPGQGLEDGEIFTLPREHRQFDAFIRRTLIASAPASEGQLSLFGET